jgi:hypothetical protein
MVSGPTMTMAQTQTAGERQLEDYVPIASVILAILSFSGPWLNISLFAAGHILSAVWFVLFAATLSRYGRRAMWRLLGAPLALFWPTLTTLVMLASAR